MTPLPDDVLVLLVLSFRVLPPSIHDGRVDVGRAVRVGLIQEAHHRQEYRPREGGNLIFTANMVNELNLQYYTFSNLMSKLIKIDH